MVKIVNGEIVPDDAPQPRPTAQPFPSIPSWSSSNQNAQQYQYVHPDQNNPPPQQGNQWGWLDERRLVFGNRISTKHLLIGGGIVWFMLGMEAALVVGLVCFIGSTDTVNRWTQQYLGNGNANRNTANNGQSALGTFFSSFFTSGRRDNDPNNDNSNANPNNDRDGRPPPKSPPPRFGTIDSLNNRKS